MNLLGLVIMCIFFIGVSTVMSLNNSGEDL